MVDDGGILVIARLCEPSEFEMWQWPATFSRIHLEQQTALGANEASWAEAVRREFGEAEAEPATILITPLVLPIIARKP